MAAKRKRKESHMVNNLIIVFSLAGVAFFYYYSQTAGRLAATQRTPEMALKSFVERFREQRSNIARPDIAQPKRMPASFEDLKTFDADDEDWRGLDSYFTEEDLKWLREDARAISFIAATRDRGLKVEDWKNKTVWEKYCLAREAVLASAPAAEVTVMQQGTPNLQGEVEVQIQISSVGMTTITMVKQRGAWRIMRFFGARGTWERDIVANRGKIPGGDD